MVRTGLVVPAPSEEGQKRGKMAHRDGTNMLESAGQLSSPVGKVNWRVVPRDGLVRDHHSGFVRDIIGVLRVLS